MCVSTAPDLECLSTSQFSCSDVPPLSVSVVSGGESFSTSKDRFSVYTTDLVSLTETTDLRDG